MRLGGGFWDAGLAVFAGHFGLRAFYKNLCANANPKQQMPDIGVWVWTLSVGHLEARWSGGRRDPFEDLNTYFNSVLAFLWVETLPYTPCGSLKLAHALPLESETKVRTGNI